MIWASISRGPLFDISDRVNVSRRESEPHVEPGSENPGILTRPLPGADPLRIEAELQQGVIVEL